MTCGSWTQVCPLTPAAFQAQSGTRSTLVHLTRGVPSVSAMITKLAFSSRGGGVADLNNQLQPLTPLPRFPSSWPGPHPLLLFDGAGNRKYQWEQVAATCEEGCAHKSSLSSCSPPFCLGLQPLGCASLAPREAHLFTACRMRPLKFSSPPGQCEHSSNERLHIDGHR